MQLIIEKNGESKYDRKLAEIDVVNYMNPVPCKRGQNKLTFSGVEMQSSF